MIDTHCHLTHPKLAGDLADVLERAAQAGLERMVTIGTGPADARAAVALAEAHPDRISATAGIDPFNAHALADGFDDAFAELETLVAGGAFCAVGEIGLDYHYDLDPKPVQRERFERQLDLAQRMDLPVVIHVREAHADMADVLAAHPDNRGVIHSFTAGPAEADRYLELGWMLAYNGVATFNSGAEVREAARGTPKDRLLIETDSPYLAPVPKRGRRCEPAFVQYTLARLAEERGDPVEALREATTGNARLLFGLP